MILFGLLDENDEDSAQSPRLILSRSHPPDTDDARVIEQLRLDKPNTRLGHAF
jgi:hypothetical protein